MLLRAAALLVLAIAVIGCGAASDALPPGAVEAYPPATIDAPATAPDLEGRAFLLDEVLVDGAPRALVAGRPIGLRFLPDRKLGIDGGCNVGGTHYDLRGDQLQPGGITQTALGCADELIAQDEWLVAFLAGPLQVTVSGEAIELRAGGTVVRGHARLP